jgi:hypothetical protein
MKYQCSRETTHGLTLAWCSDRCERSRSFFERVDQRKKPCLSRHYRTTGQAHFVSYFIPKAYPAFAHHCWANSLKGPFFKIRCCAPNLRSGPAQHLILKVLLCVCVWLLCVCCWLCTATQCHHGNYVVESFEYLIADAR